MSHTTRSRIGIVALLATFAFFGGLLGRSASAQTAGHPRTAQESSIGKAVLAELNAERHAHGLPALTVSHALMLSARRHDAQMAKDDVMSHQLPGEHPLTERMRAAGYHYRWAGENIAWNTRMSKTGAVQLQDMMYREQAPNDGHRLNVLSPHFRNVGVDVYVDTTHHKLWLTTDFGRR